MVPFAPQIQSIVIALLVAVWSAMAILARRAWRMPVSPRVLRVSLTLTATLSGALLACIVWSRPQPVRSDLAPIWASARALAKQQDPYGAVGPGRAYDTLFPQIYPMTSIVTVAPLAALPLRWADVIFVGVGFGLFTWAATSRQLMTPALVALVSMPALMTLQTSQWSLLLTGAALMPACGGLLVAKPTVGLALFAAYPRSALRSCLDGCRSGGRRSPPRRTWWRRLRGRAGCWCSWRSRTGNAPTRACWSRWRACRTLPRRTRRFRSS
jgi:hypothetical protein